MKPSTLLLLFLAVAGFHGTPGASTRLQAAQGMYAAFGLAQAPIGVPGTAARYKLQGPSEHPGSNFVTTFTLTLGPVENIPEKQHQWLRLEVTKASGKQMRLWLLSAEYPPATLKAAQATTARYILQEADARPVEFRNAVSHGAVLPSMGGWQHLWPRGPVGEQAQRTNAVFSAEAIYLGQRFTLEAVEQTAPATPPQDYRVLELRPDTLIGVPSNTRQKDEQRRYDNSDYELVRLTREDYAEMVQAGINCLRVDVEQLPWVQDLDAFYWGVGGKELPYPECLYRSTYLGASLFIDEPAVGTRDYVIRPRLLKEPGFRKGINPQIVFEAFREHFQQALQTAAIPGILAELKGRPDIELGDLNFKQENLFSWETMVESAAYQLTQDSLVPSAIVFEPPGRVGTFRTLPELDMTYGCQLPVDDPRNLTDIIYGFLRGAARLTGKTWGMSIYGAVERADAFWYLTHAYDLGATRFFFWDNFKIACVPYHECLALARDLRSHAENYPVRDLNRLNQAAEEAILLPAGYNLGHVHLGKGSLWGLPELNLERVNQKGVKYRTVMGNFFAEIERCLRLGIAFDLLWDLPSLQIHGYREIVRVREDGTLEIDSGGKTSHLRAPRTPPRPPGTAPELAVELSSIAGKAPLSVIAHARVLETSAPVFYTYGADNKGVYHNAAVGWEIYGPSEEDYRALQPEGLLPKVIKNGATFDVTVEFHLSRPGRYRLRASTVDMAGRSSVRWVTVNVTE